MRQSKPGTSRTRSSCSRAAAASIASTVPICCSSMIEPARKLHSEPIDWKKLVRVMVAGETVWENGKRTGGSPGIFLRRS